MKYMDHHTQWLYDITKSFSENFQNGPFFTGNFPEKMPAQKGCHFFGYPVNSAFGVGAGILLNAEWVHVYAKLGFDILTYKTVRTCAHPSHPLPNCLVLPNTSKNHLLSEKPIIVVQGNSPVPVSSSMTITNSFGMPSASPDFWRKDMEEAKKGLDPGQVLIASVVGTNTEKEGEEAFIADFAKCALWAKEAGADAVELDISCPNTGKAEGDVYLDPDLSASICKKAKEAVQETPLLIKIGYIPSQDDMEALVMKTAPYIRGISAINTIKKKVITPADTPALGNGREESGVCGESIRDLGLEFTSRLFAFRKQKNLDFAIVSMGGVMDTSHIHAYFEKGADLVQTVTAAMFCPFLANAYKKEIQK